MRQAFKFNDLIPKGWCKDPENSKFLLRLYTVVPCPIAKLELLFSHLTSTLKVDNLPVWLMGCQLEASGVSKVGFGNAYSHPQTGKLIIPTNVTSIDLPRSAYLILATPSQIDGTEFCEIETQARLNSVEAMISAYLGSNIIYKKVFEANFEAEEQGNYNSTSGVLATIQPCDGPFATRENCLQFEETLCCLEDLQNATKKARLKRALELFHSGKSANDIALDEKFFFYWTAIQVLCEGKGTMETNKKLQRIYEFTKSDVEQKLHWKDIVSARNDFYHSGKRIHLHKDAERYLQVLFLDLLRHELELEPIHAALASIDNLDLSTFQQTL